MFEWLVAITVGAYVATLGLRLLIEVLRSPHLNVDHLCFSTIAIGATAPVYWVVSDDCNYNKCYGGLSLDDPRCVLMSSMPICRFIFEVVFSGTWIFMVILFCVQACETFESLKRVWNRNRAPAPHDDRILPP